MCGNSIANALADTGLQTHAYRAVVLRIVSQIMNLLALFLKQLDGWIRISSELSSLLSLLYVTLGPELLRLSTLYSPALMKGSKISLVALVRARSYDDLDVPGFGTSVSAANKPIYFSAS